MASLTVWTIGHSNRTIEEFVDLLQSQEIELLADVRRFPGSRTFPHFNVEPLAETLAAASIDYRHFEALGGRRKPVGDSSNTVWRNEGFRGYADYMETPEFQKAFEALLEAAAEQRTAIMCSEVVWWRCHRSMIADLMKTKGITALHIMNAGKATEHPYTSPAERGEWIPSLWQDRDDAL